MIEIPDIVFRRPESVVFMDDQFSLVVQSFNSTVVDRHTEVVEDIVLMTSHHPGKVPHNLIREMQMLADQQQCGTTEWRAPLWHFTQLGTLRRKLIQRAGRLTRPHGALTLTMSANPAVKSELLHYLDVLRQVA